MILPLMWRGSYMTYTYLNTCINTISSLRESNIADRTIGEAVGVGCRFEMRSLGRIGLDGVYVGLRTPRQPRHTSLIRLMHDLTIANIIADRVPKLASRLPYFMGLLATGNTDKGIAVITEDATEGGTKSHQPRLPADETMALLEDGFLEDGDPADIFSTEGLSRIAFDVEGEERLLNFLPSPFNPDMLGKISGYREAEAAAIDSIPTLVWPVRPHSPLAESVRRLAP
ncbi:MAG: hypothetical protein JWL85_789 [Candidatus Saccharibacteria bacterium]|nr:hypothetical protein [Candidatus Saccharibacteria bacterium]